MGRTRRRRASFTTHKSLDAVAHEQIGAAFDFVGQLHGFQERPNHLGDPHCVGFYILEKCQDLGSTNRCLLGPRLNG